MYSGAGIKRKTTVVVDKGGAVTVRNPLYTPTKRSMKKKVMPKYYQPGSGKEIKFFDTALSFSVDNTGEVPATGQIALIPQGSTQSTRVGRKCVIRSIQLKLHLLYNPGASALAATSTYLYLVLDKQANGAAAASTDVLTSNDFAVSLINMDNSERFLILKKWCLQFDAKAGATTAYNAQTQDIDYYRKCSIPMEFNSTAGAITEIRSNNIFLLAGSNAQDDLVTVTGTARLRFSDD